ncbi:MAG: M20/M25/M40 family metallo-hydrolase, partial [Chloroflexi bacterium]|nr:M20/M25/M40 family metallo-hydrolase [Chloroflexota bacterium]
TGASLDVEDFHPAWALDEESDMVRAARAALREAGLGSETWLAPYSTNGGTSAGERGIPTVIYGAGEITDAHIADESVRIDELEAAYRGYRALAQALADPDAISA